MLRDADGAVDALFRRDAAEEREIGRLDRFRHQQPRRQAVMDGAHPIAPAAAAGAAHSRSTPPAPTKTCRTPADARADRAGRAASSRTASTAAKTARTDNSRDGSAGSRSRTRADRRAPASSYAAHWDRAPRRRAARRAATPLQAAPTSPNRRWQRASPRGRARSAPRSARTPPARCRHRVSAGWLRSTAQPVRYASNRPSLFSKVPHPATTDNVAAAKYFKSWRELNFSERVELFCCCGVDIDARKCAQSGPPTGGVTDVRRN